jgi:flagellar biosynthesis/type III secretory pathway protein FliH
MLAISGCKQLASLILITEADQEWLIRRFAGMYDILYDTPAYRDIIRYGREKGLLEGLEEGLAKGLEEGLAKGQQEKVQDLRETLLEVILELFPKIRIAAQEQVDAIADTLLLRQLIVKMHTFKTPEEALQYLRDINGNNEKH